MNLVKRMIKQKKAIERKKKQDHMLNRGSCYWQLFLWVCGKSVHNTYRDECTPDFSCCSSIRTPFIERVTSTVRLIKNMIAYRRMIREEEKQNAIGD